MRRSIATSIATLALVGAAAAPAIGDARNAHAIEVELTAEDVRTATCGDDAVDYYAIEHDLGSELGAADDIWWREPTASKGRTVHAGDGTWDTLYLGVSGPECSEVEHTGPISVYYEYGDDTYVIDARFDGKGELVRVNDVRHRG